MVPRNSTKSIQYIRRMSNESDRSIFAPPRNYEAMRGSDDAVHRDIDTADQAETGTSDRENDAAARAIVGSAERTNDAAVNPTQPK